jgi:hypothetical protein
MTEPADEIRVRVVWETGDFDGYLRLTRAMAERAAAPPDPASPRIGQGPKAPGGLPDWVLQIFAWFWAPVLATAVLWLFWADRIPPETLPGMLVAVFIVVWLAGFSLVQGLTWMTEAQDRARLRRWFAAECGEAAVVTFGPAGFAVESRLFAGRYDWADGPVVCALWPGHIAVLHPRFPLLIPRRQVDGDAAAAFARIAAWCQAEQG